MRRRRGNTVIGLFLFVIGGWLVAGSLGLALPGVGQIWPVFPLVLGLAMLAQASGGGARELDLLFAGIGATLTGGLLFPFALGVLPWRDMALYWPAFPLIGGLSFFVLYLAGGMRDPSLLVPAFAAGGLGLVAFPFTLSAVQSPLLNRIAGFWPVLLALGALVFLLRPARRGRAVRVPTAAAEGGRVPAETPPAEMAERESPSDDAQVEAASGGAASK